MDPTREQIQQDFVGTFMTELNYAVKQFGEYTLADKGIEEIMDPRIWIEILMGMTAPEANAVLKAISAAGENGPNGAYEIVQILEMMDEDEISNEWLETAIDGVD